MVNGCFRIRGKAKKGILSQRSSYHDVSLTRITGEAFLILLRPVWIRKTGIWYENTTYLSIRQQFWWIRYYSGNLSDITILYVDGHLTKSTSVGITKEKSWILFWKYIWGVVNLRNYPGVDSDFATFRFAWNIFSTRDGNRCIRPKIEQGFENGVI